MNHYFNGIEDSRVAIAITGYGLQDVKSVYGGPDLGNVGFARTFNADTTQEKSMVDRRCKGWCKESNYWY